MQNSIVAALLVMPMLGLAQVDREPASYRVLSEAWSSGQLLGRPELVVESGKSSHFEVGGATDRWRLGIEIEEPGEHEGAKPGAVWITVVIEQRIDGEWQFLTDTMLGMPSGKPGRITVLGEDESASDNPRDHAPLYLELSAEPIAGPRR